MIRIRCRCGEVLHAEAQHVGRKVRCRCGRTHTVVLPRAAPAGSGTSRWRSAGRRFFPEWPRAATGAKRSGRGRARSSTGLPARYPAAGRWTRIGAFGCLALSLAALVVVWGFGDRNWLGTLALFSGRWLLLVPLLPVAAAAALFDRKSLVTLTVAALIILVPVMGLRFGRGVREDAASDDPTGRLRVASFNTEGDMDNTRELLALLERWEIDVALVQECPFRSERLEVGVWTLHGVPDLCIISRHPFRPLDRMYVGDLVPRNTYGGSGMAMRYELRLPDRTVTLVNVHLETARRGLRGLAQGDLGRMANNLLMRRVESRAAARWIGEDVGDVVVAGDFNMPVESAIYRSVWGDFANSFSHAGRGFGFTRDNGWIRVRIDHVLSGPNWQPQRAWVGPAIGSDHRPVFAELRHVDAPVRAR